MLREPKYQSDWRMWLCQSAFVYLWWWRTFLAGLCCFPSGRVGDTLTVHTFASSLWAQLDLVTWFLEMPLKILQGGPKKNVFIWKIYHEKINARFITYFNVPTEISNFELIFRKYFKFKNLRLSWSFRISEPDTNKLNI